MWQPSLNRRQFILALSGTVLAPYVLGESVMPETFRGVMGCAKKRGRFFAVATDRQLNYRFSVPLPARGHAIAMHPSNTLAVVVARRPGAYLLPIDTQNGRPWQPLSPVNDRFFYGHAVFSEDGQWLYTTEGKSPSCEGVIGIYRVQQQKKILQRVGEWPIQGIGPHELAWRSSEELVVAVGGIQTRGRDKLNIESMAPSLQYVHCGTGQLLEEVTLTEKQASIRHLDVSARGDVVIGMQHQGDFQDSVPLVAIHQKGEALVSVKADPIEWLRYKGYIGSVSCSANRALVTSPRGNCFGIISLADKTLTASQSLKDVCAVAANGKGWLLGSGLGYMLDFHSSSQYASKSLDGVAWDNHWEILLG
ncbi:DUF1513 domain-containing protein [Thaumasiovibrio subtropicus]|uniref:DUF1513 domain-containing protein n=1 Tax=Thaumasiovibrio subtropicus TaxID=1891207 RepID=UPI000B35DFD7|nr:DUF1513 domain-containing protein [Thaumasiovibrio subtropicus]